MANVEPTMVFGSVLYKFANETEAHLRQLPIVAFIAITPTTQRILVSGSVAWQQSGETDNSSLSFSNLICFRLIVDR